MAANNLRLIDKEKDYPMLEAWWRVHGFPAVPCAILPPLGVIHNETAAAWLYMDNGGSGVAMLEWMVTDPTAKPKEAARSLMEVSRFLQSEAKRMEYHTVLTTCRQAGLARLLTRTGFIQTDSQMIHLVASL